MGKNITIVLLSIALLVSVWFNLKGGVVNHGIQDGTTTTDIVRDTITDTITYFLPLPKDSIVLRYVTERLPISHDTLVQVIHDSVEVVIPITQKMYSDSTYTAYVSGYKPRLDSISVYPLHEIVTITKTRWKRWGVGVQAGCGITTQGVGPYVGIGLHYNLFGF